MIRFIAYPIKKCWVVIKEALSNLGHYIWKYIRVVSRAVKTEGDVELGEVGGREILEANEESSSEGSARRAKTEFRSSLQKMFSDAARVEEIMKNIKLWEDGR